MEGPSRRSSRPRSRMRSTMASARSWSCRTRPQCAGRLVGGEDHRALAQVAVVDDVEEHVGGVGAVGEVADLVDDEHVRVSVARRAPRASRPCAAGARRARR